MVEALYKSPSFDGVMPNEVFLQVGFRFFKKLSSRAIKNIEAEVSFVCVCL